MVDDQDNQVANGDEGDDAGVFQRVESAQEAQRDDEEHKGGDPKVAVDKVGKVFGVVGDALHDAGHEVADDDHVGDADAEALDGNGHVKDDGGVGVCELGEGEEGGGSAVEVSRASGLEVEAKGGRKGGPEDEDDTEHDAHVREHKGHGEGASSYDCFMEAAVSRGRVHAGSCPAQQRDGTEGRDRGTARGGGRTSYSYSPG